jgi:hypothetical protein
MKTSTDLFSSPFYTPFQNFSQFGEIFLESATDRRNRFYGSSFCAWDYHISLIIPSFPLYTQEELKGFFEDSSGDEIIESMKGSCVFTIPNSLYFIYLFIFV